VSAKTFPLTIIDEVIKFQCLSKLKNAFFKIISINAQSLANIDHSNILRHLLTDVCVDLIAVSETWLNSKHPDKICAVQGYNLVRNDREGSRGGGVALLIKQNIKFKILTSSPHFFDPLLTEFICCEINFENSKLLVIALYRRPNPSCRFDNFFTELQKQVFHYDEVIVVGDFNINFAADTQTTRELVSHLDDFSLSRIPIENTHKSYNSLTTIDAFFTSSQVDVNCFGKLPNLLSTHEILYIVLNKPHSSNSPEQRFIREFNSVDADELLDKALQLNWPMCSSHGGVDDKVASFSDMILAFYNNVLPLKLVKAKKKFQPQLPQPIKVCIKQRDNLRKLAFRAGHQLIDVFERFREIKNRVKQLIATFHRSIIFSKLSNLASSTQIWSALRNMGLIKEKSNLQVLPLDIDDMVEGLTTVPDIDLTKINHSYKLASSPECEQFHFAHVQPLQIKNALFEIDTSAEGSDGICVKMLKLIWMVILPTLTNIVNSSMQQSYFPVSWKRAVLCPIPKIRNPKSVKDFRPISLLCTISKVLEKVVHDQILTFVNKLNLLDPLQSGYRKLFSTSTALLRIAEDIRLAISKREVVLVVFLDYSKAFDCVDHKLLLGKLRQLKFSDSVLKWLQSYLSNRECAVKGKDGKFSKWVKLNRGVPQGSVLGPLLFSLYTHDIGKILKYRCKYHIYADDTQLYINCKLSELNEAIQIMNFILEDVASWSASHGLKLNASKTQAMLIASQNTQKMINHDNLSKLRLHGTDITYFDTVKNLGITFDKNLAWGKQISSVSQKIYGTLNNLYKFRAMTPESIRLKLIKTLVLPHLDYCSFVYCNINKEQEKRLQVLMNAAIYYVYDVPFAARLSPYFLKSNILKVKERHELELLLMSHKIVHKNCPPYLNDLVKFVSDASSRSTRAHKFKLRIPLVGIEAPEGSFSVKSCRLWNNLSEKLCTNQNINSFKSEVKNLLFKRYEEEN
jgi:Reverse transcriptase (RNA-dependent DNA polymerase)/Endonuclease-reverse transcriptase